MKWSEVKVIQSCPTRLCNPMDYTVHGILQARILKWVPFNFSGGSSQPRSPALQEDSLLAEPKRKPNNTGVGCHFLLECMKVKSENEVAQLCPTRSDPMDCSPPGSSIHGMFQARALGVPLSINCPTHLFMFSHSLCGCKHDKDVGSQSSRLLIWRRAFLGITEMAKTSLMSTVSKRKYNIVPASQGSEGTKM